MDEVKLSEILCSLSMGDIEQSIAHKSILELLNLKELKGSVH